MASLEPKPPLPGADHLRLSPCGGLARRADQDRYLATLMATADRREALFALVAFAAEVAKTREVVSEPMLGQIRLQWWRDALAECFSGATPRAHEVVASLASAVRAHDLPMALFARHIDAREVELDSDAPFQTLEAMEAYARETAGTLLTLFALVEGDGAHRAEDWGSTLGAAWGMVGLVRATPFLAAQRRTALPRDRLAAVGLGPGSLAEGPQVSASAQEAVRSLCKDVCARAEGLLAACPKGRGTPATAAHAVLLRGHMMRLSRAGFDPADGRVQSPPPWRALTLTATRLLGRL